jgi:protein-tyrosine phosphatase
MAEGLLRRALEERLDGAAPEVGSAGTIAIDGAPAMPESIEAARERGVDIREHAARLLTPTLIDNADLVVTMAAEHRDAVGRLVPGSAPRTFTLKELTRVLEATRPGPEERLDARVGEAAAARASGAPVNRFDEDVVDPLGMPLDTYRAIAWELDEWINRLVTALYGPVPARAEGA